MTIQTLISCVNQDVLNLPAKMNLECDAVIVNQCDKDGYEEFTYNGYRIQVYHMSDRGVGLSRNTVLLHATADIVLFADEDIVYNKGYAQQILGEFEKRPDADILIFNMDVIKERATYFTEQEKEVRWYNSGRYPTYSMAVRRERLLAKNVWFSLLFGGGAKYSNGEDSMFIWDCLKKGLKAIALPVMIGKEEARPSTWFNGYNEKFFFDRGVLYQALYGKMAKPFALRFLRKHKGMMFDDKEACKLSMKEAYSLMKKGMEEMK